MSFKHTALLFFIPLLGALLIAGARLGDRAGTYYGDETPLGNGTVRSLVTTDAEGRPLTVGVLLTASALQGLPSHEMAPHHETVLTLPMQAREVPFDHISVDWNPMGHEPEGMYDQPHFDLHFYMMTEAERNAIDPADAEFEAKASRHPAAAFIPAGYVPAPGAVPRMGAHWISTSAPEMNGQPFSRTFLYGSWDGRITFLEPMITNSFIESVRDVEGHTVREAISQPDAVQTPGYYPTAYSIQYDDKANTYAFVLEGLTHRQ